MPFFWALPADKAPFSDTANTVSLPVSPGHEQGGWSNGGTK